MRHRKIVKSTKLYFSYWIINPFISMRNQHCNTVQYILSGFQCPKKCRDISSEGYAAHLVEYNSLRQIIMVI
jgi:hypothetical protein